MSKENTLDRVNNDIENGNLGKARDRLIGLIASNPDALELRTKLGNICWKLQYPELAGKYWYLEGEKTAEMTSAIMEFEKRYKNNQKEIIRAIDFHGTKAVLENIFSEETILYWEKEEEQRRIRLTNRKTQMRPKVNDSKIGCIMGLFALIAVCVLLTLGVVQIVSWVK